MVLVEIQYIHMDGKVAESFSNQYFSRLVKYLFIVLASSAFSDNSFFFQLALVPLNLALYY